MSGPKFEVGHHARCLVIGSDLICLMLSELPCALSFEEEKEDTPRCWCTTVLLQHGVNEIQHGINHNPPSRQKKKKNEKSANGNPIRKILIHLLFISPPARAGELRWWRSGAGNGGVSGDGWCTAVKLSQAERMPFITLSAHKPPP